MAVQIAANTAQFNSAMAQAQKTNTAFISSLNKVGAALGITFGAHQVYRGLEYGVKTLAGFEHQMDTVAAITGATGKDFKALEKNALDLGKTTEYTAKQVGELQTEYGRLGFSTKEILNSTKATIDLATATGSDLARSSEIAGSTLRAFQLDAVEMGRVTDVMASSFNKSALGLDNFAESIKYVAPVAHSVNVSLEETTAMLGVLADAGIKGSQAGTSLRRIFTQLTADGRPLAERMDELARKGITLADANDEVGLYAQTALLVLASQKKKVDELTVSLNNSAGETQRVADIMRDNLVGDVNKFTSALEGAILKGNGLIAVMREIVQLGTQQISNEGSTLNNIISNLQTIVDLRDLISKGRLSDPARELERQMGFFNLENPQGQDFIEQYRQLKELADQAGKKLIILREEGNNVRKVFIKPEPVKFATDTNDATKAVVELTEAQKRAALMAEKYKEGLADIRHELANLAVDAKMYAEINDRQMGLDALSNLQNSKYGFNPQAADGNSLDESGFFNQKSLEEFFKSEQELISESMDWWDQWAAGYKKNQEMTREESMNTAQQVAALSQGFGDMFVAMADGADAGAKAFGRASSQIVDAIGRMIMAKMINKAIDDKATDFNFFAKLALIGVATGVASSLLRKIGKNSGSSNEGFRTSSSGNFYSSKNQSMEPIKVEVTGVIRGQDLAIVGQNYNRVQNRIGG